MKYKVTYILKNGDKKNGVTEAPSESDAARAFENEGFIDSVERYNSSRPAGGSNLDFNGFNNYYNDSGGGYNSKDNNNYAYSYNSGSVPGRLFGFRAVYELILFFKKPDDFQMSLFSRELSTLMRAGLTMPESLDVIEGHITNKMLKTAVTDIKKSIVAGSSFNGALRGHPAVFNDLFVCCVRGGENASSLAETLDILSQNLRNSHRMKSRIINILLYPLVIILITFCIFSFLLFYVLPSFETVFYDMRIEIPPYTAALFSLSGFIRNNIALLTALFIIGGVCLILSGALKILFSAFLRIMRRVPVISGLLNNYSLFIFSGMLSALLRSAASALDSFSTALFALRDTASDEKRRTALDILKTGGSFSKAVAGLGLADSALERMCAVGERSGRISDMMDLINGYYLENLHNSLERLAEALEPLIIFITGIFIAALILSVFLPVIKITMGGI